LIVIIFWKVGSGICLGSCGYLDFSRGNGGDNDDFYLVIQEQHHSHPAASDTLINGVPPQ